MTNTDMTAEAKLIHMYGFDLMINIHAWPKHQSYMGPTWWRVDVEQKGEGIKLEIEGRGETFDEAVSDAYDKYIRSIYRGMPKSFQGLTIAPPEKVVEVNDEIPF